MGEQAQSQMFNMQQMQMMQQQQGGGGGGGPQVPIWMQNQGGGDQADSGPAGSAVAKQRQRGDVVNVAGLDMTVIKSKVQTIAANIMGFDDVAELEMDSPFMESGLTSSSSVLLRDEIMAEMQGVTLPITLVFDYPSPNAVAEYIADKTS